MERRKRQPAFTLLELILVMLVIAILAGILAPAMARFTMGRSVENFGHRMIGAAQYARAQSISESRVYRLNFDQGTGQFWLTADTGGGNFEAPSGEYNQRYAAPTGVRMQILQSTSAPPSPVIMLPWPATITPQPFTQPTALLDGTQAGTGSIYTFPQSSSFVQFQPTGRTDPATISLTDTTGRSFEIRCATPTDTFREVTQ
jgi:prepilin-type N-terminal cleavage/methylation domain-containing protein